jgi:alkylhydroperoxidase family enzyme
MGTVASAGPPASPLFPALDNDEAWARLPRADPPLPAWARVLAASVPRATVALLELDRLHRVNNPLGVELAAKLRWAAADALGSDYAKKYAEADLRRAGLTDQDVDLVVHDRQNLPAAERAALAFAHKLTRAGYTVTDAEVAELLEHFGAEKVVAMAHTVAFANFQDRIILALQVEVEPGGPFAPVHVRLDPGKAVQAPARPPWEEVRKAIHAGNADARPAWEEPLDVEKGLDRQKNRTCRIPLPGPDRLALVPPELKEEAARVLWTTVSAGYQPQLTKAWFDGMRAFQGDAQLDRVFSGTLFWVVTRSNECFY